MKKTDKQAWLHGGIGVLVGIAIASVFTVAMNRSEHQSLIKKVEAHVTQNDSPVTDHRSMSMAQMTEALQGKTGDDFDKTFIEMMIAHHQGAVEMAELAQKQAKHEEIKTLSNNIVTAQLKEISEMYEWQKAWGYTSGDVMMHTGH